MQISICNEMCFLIFFIAIGIWMSVVNFKKMLQTLLTATVLLTDVWPSFECFLLRTLVIFLQQLLFSWRWGFVLLNLGTNTSNPCHAAQSCGLASLTVSYISGVAVVNSRKLHNLTSEYSFCKWAVLHLFMNRTQI